MEALTDEQKNLLAALITQGLPLDTESHKPSAQERQGLIRRLNTAQAKQSCDCSTCITLTLHYPADSEATLLASRPETPAPRTVLTATTQDGSALLLAHLVGHYLTDLEIAPIGQNTVCLPRPEELVFLAAAPGKGAEVPTGAGQPANI
ncbi:hypothetical protein [Rothia sp. P4278]|uniref:hypothetical protein n=1 Tax=Rothia sp. P4278 TaxID=3402658 RepID=UPI003AE360CB